MYILKRQIDEQRLFGGIGVILESVEEVHCFVAVNECGVSIVVKHRECVIPQIGPIVSGAIEGGLHSVIVVIFHIIQETIECIESTESGRVFFVKISQMPFTEEICIVSTVGEIFGKESVLEGECVGIVWLEFRLLHSCVDRVATREESSSCGCARALDIVIVELETECGGEVVDVWCGEIRSVVETDIVPTQIVHQYEEQVWFRCTGDLLSSSVHNEY